MLDRRAGGLRAYQAALEEAQELGKLGTFILDLREGKYRLVGLLARVYGRDEISFAEADREVARVFHPDDRGEVVKLLDALRTFKPYEGEFRMYLDGEAHWFQGRTKIMYDADGRPNGMIGTAVDITDRKLEAERYRKLAYTDPDTGIANRISLLEDTESEYAALILIYFQWVGATSERSPENRKYNARSIVRIMQEIAPPGVKAIRYGDEIGALTIPRGMDAARVSDIAEDLAVAFDRPVQVGSDTLVVTPRLGIAFAGEEQQHNIGELARRAEAALREAIRADVPLAVFTGALEQKHKRRATIERQLRNAVAGQQLSLMYQPIVSIATGRVIAAEALLRWECPGLGNVAPDEFIQLAEDSGAIVQVGEWVLREAFSQLREWKDAGLPAVRMAVNISVRQARQPDFVMLMRSLCAVHGIEPREIELELTERAIIHPGGPGARNLETLRSLGVRISVDDFGTGYSALSYLATMPADTLKVDRSFISPIGDELFQREVAASVIDLAHKRGLCVIGEGVETKEQLARLREMDCDEAQGFHFAPALPPNDFAKFMGVTLPL